MQELKKERGQYYTAVNPFNHILFREWFENINKNDIILEPFAGSNNIIKHLREIGISNECKCFDIEPSVSVVNGVDIEIKDTIKDFPQGYRVAITNPPYLAKNSASKLKLPYPQTDYDDLYKLCLDLMVNNCEFVGAIIPEPFITAELFVDRLYGVISLNYKMFDDTECPVCLALFGGETKSPKIYVGDEYIGTLEEKEQYKNELFSFGKSYNKWKFNNAEGTIGVHCVDNLETDNIYFHYGELISVDKIKVSNRAFSRIKGLPDNIDRDLFIEKCNEIVNEYRNNTKDVFLTSFKGLRKDNKYRKRIDFKTVKCIMNKALTSFNEKNLDNSK